MAESAGKELDLEVPPLPLLREACAIVDVVTSGLDDIAEDCAKLLIFYVLWIVFKRLLSAVRTSVGKISMISSWVVLVVACYRHIDCYADLVGDMVQPVQDVLKVYSGKSIEPKREVVATDQQLPLVLYIVDDVIEDSFKAVCVGSHAFIGNLLRTGFIQVAEAGRDDVPSAAIKAVGWFIAMGPPAEMYTYCNEYGDKLGNVVQRVLRQRIMWHAN
eukprot:TRINITY_DN69242_c0_g1_i1.p1 TRINITY_DN69242_c0_g1~~TRINITY_DN69242_c0_g1_i1.p1  ORF type:complete len:217 (+),score=34.40 TRINITY_DN69242_c0_g1_i1:94-744(+)